ncbi:hypothetical protein [Flavivirga spongiicola]|uniref:Uncharacterized protein n=1 Tax=Flavivirga spongiicola TaxID=421621 RepID=A0ABU7XNS3_9FLAO|nr:hypothetical protein [Flavivirga sp. MEBiC05379]MDO5981859.1 hypothetical protein [Flavivirga sp. MEBiC05379]
MKKQKLKRLTKIGVLMLFMALTYWNCEKEPETNLDDSSFENNLINVQVVDDKLKFENNESLATFVKQKTEEEFKNEIKNLSDKGFSSLRPVFDENDDVLIDDFLKQKKSKIAKKDYLYSLKDVSEEIDLNDELISDTRFASILNKNREIYVGDKYFIYTTKALYFCKIEDEDYLKEYLKNMKNTLTSKSAFIKTNKSAGETLSLAPISGEVREIDSRISAFETDDQPVPPDEDKEGNGGSGGGSGTPSSTTVSIPMLASQNFGMCQYSENSLFQQVFGNTVKCNDYHDSKHRIQTKVWNENYFLFASIGVSAKYQKKRFIGWSESVTADEVRLGINHAIYTYKSPLSPQNPFDPNRVVVNYKGKGYDLQGNVVPKFPVNPTAWPYPQNATIGEIDIEIFGNELFYSLSGKDANKSINQLLSLIRSNYKGLSGDRDDIATDLENDRIGVNIIKFLPNKFKVVRADILKKHGSQVKESFDSNFLLTLTNNSNANFKTFTDQFNAKKYQNLDIDIYGAALRNGVWKGKRIVGKIE